jgi:hypothetical protein
LLHEIVIDQSDEKSKLFCGDTFILSQFFRSAALVDLRNIAERARAASQ